jgi:hypothetical protein
MEAELAKRHGSNQHGKRGGGNISTSTDDPDEKGLHQ